MKRKTLPIAGTPGREKKIKMNTPKIYNRLIREVTLQTPLGPQKSNAHFDTGANIFALDDQSAAQFSLSYLEHDEPLRVFRFSIRNPRRRDRPNNTRRVVSSRTPYDLRR